LTPQVYKHIIRWGIIIATLFIVSLILWNTYTFFQRFKDEERIKMEILAATYKRLNTNLDLDADVTLEQQIMESNYSIPMILTDAKGKVVYYANLDSAKVAEKDFLQKKLQEMNAQNQPLLIQYPNSSKQYIYYSDSDILTNLKYYPLALLLILFLFFVVILLFTQTNKIAAENKLWTSMAKETAHQIGTPLTSLLGWVTLLRENDENKTIADEVEKDVHRLEIIANRFSKIGSETPLQANDIVQLTRESFSYLQSRLSKRIIFKFTSSSDKIILKVNPELYAWVIENLVKNAVDAMQGKGTIALTISEQSSSVLINVSDTGKGIPKASYKKIFEPGYTTKKRGWGLGLSLSKRIIEDFHRGKIYVKESEIDKGTTFCVKLPK